MFGKTEYTANDNGADHRYHGCLIIQAVVKQPIERNLKNKKVKQQLLYLSCAGYIISPDKKTGD